MSSGNCGNIESGGGDSFLVDMDLSGREILAGMEAAGAPGVTIRDACAPARAFRVLEYVDPRLCLTDIMRPEINGEMRKQGWGS